MISDAFPGAENLFGMVPQTFFLRRVPARRIDGFVQMIIGNSSSDVTVTVVSDVARAGSRFFSGAVMAIIR